MNSKTFTRTDISQIMQEKIGFSHADSARIIESILQEISTSLERKEAVKIARFGSFNIKQKEERIGRNPKTGVTAPIAARHVICFKTCNTLKIKLHRCEL
jgi:integration host factor subunit alpha